jgi:hypothetical protein
MNRYNQSVNHSIKSLFTFKNRWRLSRSGFFSFLCEFIDRMIVQVNFFMFPPPGNKERFCNQSTNWKLHIRQTSRDTGIKKA